MNIGDRVNVAFDGIITNIGTGFDDKQIIVSVKIGKEYTTVMAVPIGACQVIQRAEAHNGRGD